jgi:hypothetical protein
MHPLLSNKCFFLNCVGNVNVNGRLCCTIQFELPPNRITEIVTRRKNCLALNCLAVCVRGGAQHVVSLLPPPL